MEAEPQLAILRQLNKEVHGGKCAVGPGGKTVGYLAHGEVPLPVHSVGAASRSDSAGPPPPPPPPIDS